MVEAAGVEPAASTGSDTSGAGDWNDGPVNDPGFFQRFFASLDKSLFLEKPATSP